ncbi:MAG: hypothetical protein CL489_17855 [Acidobacteria bacterium]|nr:hypothetical protein [Acidobacteriota bacterium]
MATPTESTNAGEVWAKLGPVNARYPWDSWLDGQLWRVGPEDITRSSFRNLSTYVNRIARARGITVRTRRAEYDEKTRTYGCLYIQKTSDTRRRPKRKATNA